MLGVDFVYLFVVGNGFERDMRDAFVDEALFDVARSNDFSRCPKATKVAAADFRFFPATFG